MLQSIFEYQTLICRLTGMEAANASLYDGATSLAEAAVAACVVTRRSKVLVSRSVNPHYRRVLQSYLEVRDLQPVEIQMCIRDRLCVGYRLVELKINQFA